MRETIHQLKAVAQRNRVTVDDVLELLAEEECSQCCKTSGGGNGSCPPPKTEIETA